MDWPTILTGVSTGIGVVLGGLINWFFARKGTKQLRREADNLRKLMGVTIRILDEAKLLPDNVEPTKDGAGNYTGGLTYRSAATAQGRASAQANARVIRRPDSANPEDGAGEEHQQRE